MKAAIIRRRFLCKASAKQSSSIANAKPVTIRKARLRPCIDIHKGKVKQIVGSTLKDIKKTGDAASELVTNFVSKKPAEWYSSLYKEDGLYGGHIIMLGQDPDSRRAAIAALRAWPGGMHVGGGITPENACTFLDAGASHVIVTSYVFRDGRLDYERLQKLVDSVGADKVVLDLSCRFRDGSYWVVTDRWQKFSELKVDGHTLELLSKSCAEFLVHGVDVEGKQCGIDKDLITILGASSPLPSTYAGGVKDMGDLDLVSVAGNGRVDVTVGSALDIFGGSLPYADAVRWHRGEKKGTV